MSLGIDLIEKRVEKNNFIEIAGEFYIDINSKLIKKLNEENKEVYIGIKNSNGIYTVIGKDYLYFSDKSICNRSISNIKFLEIAKKIVRDSKKELEDEFIEISKNNFIWIYNIQMLCAMLNLVLFLTRTDGYGVKPPDGPSMG